MNLSAKNQPRDINSATRTRFLMIVMRLAPACLLLGWAIGGFKGILYGLPGTILAALAIESLSGSLCDGSINILYGTGRLDRSMRDQFIASLSQARFHKMSQRHDLALGCIDEVLAVAPNYTEALFLKAQILWDGYRDSAAAKKCLMHVMKVESDRDAPHRRWALALYKEIAGHGRSRNRLNLNEK